MRQFNAIIIDDEYNVRQTLEILIKQNCPEIKLLGKADSAEEGRKLIRENDVHFIFLDISMPIENGFDFLSTIPKEKYAIIFITAYEEYALKAIKANAIDYLLKPIDTNELRQAVTKSIKYFELRNKEKEYQKIYEQSLNNLSEQVAGGVQSPKRITVVENFGFRIVEVDKIRYLEADSNYTILYLNDFEKIVSSKSLGEFEKVLNPKIFFRIHKSHIINLKYLKSFSSYQGYFALLDDNTRLSISRRRFLEFRETLNGLSKVVE
jgi:two-component system LytT family response regulator